MAKVITWVYILAYNNSLNEYDNAPVYAFLNKEDADSKKAEEEKKDKVRYWYIYRLPLIKPTETKEKPTVLENSLLRATDLELKDDFEFYRKDIISLSELIDPLTMNLWGRFWNPCGDQPYYRLRLKSYRFINTEVIWYPNMPKNGWCQQPEGLPISAEQAKALGLV
jgi:hypothetical protein